MKKQILTIGYYADFSRFFKNIADETRRLDPDIEFLHIDLFLSGYFYSFINRRKSIYLPAQRVSHQQLQNASDDSFFRQFIGYHQRILPSLDENALLNQARKYYCYLDALLTDYQPGLIILSGDSRMPAEIIKYLAGKHQIKIAYFEQAPLGRTIIDFSGVNANCSFRYFDNGAIDQFSGKDYEPLRYSKWNGYKYFRVVDLLIEKMLPGTVPVEQRRPVREKLSKRDYVTLLESKALPESSEASAITLLLVLQVPDDVNMVYHSPWFSSHAQIVKQVAENLPRNARLIVREHPLFKRLYEPELYRYIATHSQIYIDNASALDNAIAQADLVIVNNSTVGLESIEKGKKVAVLGNSYYDHSPLCYKYTGGNIRDFLENALRSADPDKMFRKKYLDYLFNAVFIPGHFRDMDGPAPSQIAKWIVTHV